MAKPLTSMEVTNVRMGECQICLEGAEGGNPPLTDVGYLETGCTVRVLSQKEGIIDSGGDLVKPCNHCGKAENMKNASGPNFSIQNLSCEVSSSIQDFGLADGYKSTGNFEHSKGWDPCRVMYVQQV